MCKNCSVLLKKVIFLTNHTFHTKLQQNLNRRGFLHIKSLEKEYYKFLYAMKFSLLTKHSLNLSDDTEYMQDTLKKYFSDCDIFKCENKYKYEFVCKLLYFF